MAGDFNAKTGSAALNSHIYHEVIGKYGKGKINSNGYSLGITKEWQSTFLI